MIIIAAVLITVLVTVTTSAFLTGCKDIDENGDQ